MSQPTTAAAAAAADETVTGDEAALPTSPFAEARDAAAARVQAILDRFEQHAWTGQFDYEQLARHCQFMALYQLAIAEGRLDRAELELRQLQIQEHLLKEDFAARCTRRDEAALRGAPSGQPIRVAALPVGQRAIELALPARFARAARRFAASPNATAAADADVGAGAGAGPPQPTVD